MPLLSRFFAKPRSLSLVMGPLGLLPFFKTTTNAFRGFSFHYKPAGKGYGGHHPWRIQIMRHSVTVTDMDDHYKIQRTAKTAAWINHNPFSAVPHSAGATLQPIKLPFTRTN